MTTRCGFPDSANPSRLSRRYERVIFFGHQRRHCRANNQCETPANANRAQSRSATGWKYLCDSVKGPLHLFLVISHQPCFIITVTARGSQRISFPRIMTICNPPGPRRTIGVQSRSSHVTPHPPDIRENWTMGNFINQEGRAAITFTARGECYFHVFYNF